MIVTVVLMGEAIRPSFVDQSVDFGWAESAHAALRPSRSGIDPSCRASSWISSGSVRASNGMPFTVTIQANGCRRPSPPRSAVRHGRVESGVYAQGEQ